MPCWAGWRAGYASWATTPVQQRRLQLDTSELARKVTDILADRQAEDITVLDLRGSTILADYFVIATGTTDRQLRAMADALAEQLRDEGQRVRRIEGAPESGWVLADLGGVIVHLFSPERRAYYHLEQLWSGAKVVVRMA
ncbi:MAG TPA: ribosome silencing factor [Anaerolineae bacterium]|nr:ribosome silencing factor [Anaerolineae bacterium]HOQ99651.1 ribosome silencing factor [Anaerolineae bacterium]